DGDEGLGRGADDARRLPRIVMEVEQVHEGARVRMAQHPVDAQRVRRTWGVESLPEHDLEDLPVDDLLLRLRHAVEVDLSRCPRGHLGVGRADVDDIGRARAAEAFEQLADPPYARR